jgi:hypothetical protein
VTEGREAAVRDLLAANRNAVELSKDADLLQQVVVDVALVVASIQTRLSLKLLSVMRFR